jgi:hypothetical protein
LHRLSESDVEKTSMDIVGSVPAYVEGFNPNLSLADDIRDVILAPGSMFIVEPAFLLYDDVRELSTHMAMAILKTIEG